MVRVIYGAFEQYSKEYRVELVDIVPISSDFKIVHIATNTEVFIEAKRSHCHFQLQEYESAHMRHYRLARGLEGKGIFTWKANWDYIYTTHTGRDEVEGLFLPRDAIPSHWWNAGPGDRELEWPLEKLEDLKKYVVDLTSGDRLVTAVERVLKGNERDTGSMKAKKAVQIADLPLESFCEVAVHPRSEQITEKEVDNSILQLRHCWSTSTFRRGFGSSEHLEIRGRTYEFWAAEALTEICRKW